MPICITGNNYRRMLVEKKDTFQCTFENFVKSKRNISLSQFKKFDQLKLTTVAYENNEKRIESIYSKRIRAGKRRTYFFDVRATRGNDYYLTITESRKRFTGEGYDRHKIFLYKEDFNKFIKGMIEAVDYVKTELMPDFDFDAFNHEDAPSSGDGDNMNEPLNGTTTQHVEEVKLNETPAAETTTDETTASDQGLANEEVDKW